MLQDTPGQLVCVRDMVLNTPLISDWGDIRSCKQEQIYKTNQKNCNRTIIEYMINYWCEIKSEQIWGSVQSPLPDYQGLNKWNYYHMMGRRTSAYKY